ncbi:MAG: FAD/NAD(P)-binding oxidoreductase [Dehalococcoidia bacterium]|nr:FAD/NAD(P)-binding oxidoreductase [Dehalococcoidia bacterium]
MSGKTVLILGGGIGGLSAATHLRRLSSPAEPRIVVVERNRSFSACMANLWIMTGERKDPAEGQRELSSLAGAGIEVVQADVQSIDPAAKTVQTTAGELEGDYIIIALGAELNPRAVPGFAEAALNLYDIQGALQIQRALEEFEGGRIIVLIARTPFSCPAAPYEAAFLIDSLLRQQGVRQRTEIALYTPEDQPMLVAGPNVGPALVKMLEERGIELHWEQIPMKIDPASRRILFELEDTTFDLLVGVPPHTAPRPVRESGLLDASGWIPVDQRSLQTRHAGVFAIGDVTAIRLPVGMFLPKAGVFADDQARVAAANIAAEITGERMPAQYTGHGFCYIEVGDGMAAYGSGNFYGIPAPSVTLEPPSQRYRQEKVDQERTLLALWD